MKHELLMLLSGAMLSLGVSGCSGTSAVSAGNTTVIAACDTNAAAISVLADMRKAGRLSAAQVALVNNDIAATDPVCSSPSSAPAMNAAQMAAFAELKSMAGVQ